MMEEKFTSCVGRRRGKLEMPCCSAKSEAAEEN